VFGPPPASGRGGQFSARSAQKKGDRKKTKRKKGKREKQKGKKGKGEKETVGVALTECAHCP
jgi:hypothetical protein